jgi:hypothetical protein
VRVRGVDPVDCVSICAFVPAAALVFELVYWPQNRRTSSFPRLRLRHVYRVLKYMSKYVRQYMSKYISEYMSRHTSKCLRNAWHR